MLNQRWFEGGINRFSGREGKLYTTGGNGAYTLF